MRYGWIGILIGLALIFISYYTPLRYLPKKLENSDVTLSHLRYLYLESFTLILGGLFIIVLDLGLLML